jgi:hypothetical protein
MGHVGEELKDIVLVLEVILATDEFHITQRVLPLYHEVSWRYTVGLGVITHLVTYHSITDDGVITIPVNMSETTTVGTHDWSFLHLLLLLL